VAGLDKLETVKTLRTEPSGKHRFEENRALAVQLKNLSYQYNHHNQPIRNISLNIAAGEKLAILADSGTGKITLAELITGLRLATEGQLTINEIDLRMCHLPSLRQQMDLIRRIEIQQTTILDNLQLNNPNIKLEQVNSILKQFNLLNAIFDLPNGFDTVLNVLGTPLSTIQVKLLVIARALLQNPKLLIIDGLLDEIDATSLKLVCDVLLNLDDCTVVVMTRSSAIAQCFARVVTWSDLQSEDNE
jgi:ABC-type bacteriocin/lantibiotic exporter with double-glycine peptidase domain